MPETTANGLMFVELHTMDGRYVTTALVPAHKHLPAVVQWGERTFVPRRTEKHKGPEVVKPKILDRPARVPNKLPVYRETNMHFILPEYSAFEAVGEKP